MSAARECACPLARHVHGTSPAYTVCGCRCLPCAAAYTGAVRQRRHGQASRRRTNTVSRVGTRRRIEALHALGWSGGQLAELLGATFQAVFDLRTKDTPIYPGTAQRVADLYDQLWDVEPPPSSQGTKTLNWARRRGFAPPLAWDDDAIDDPAAAPSLGGGELDDLDEVAVERLMAGTLHVAPGATSPERVEAVRRLAARGYSDPDIATTVGGTDSGIGKLRERHGIPAGRTHAAAGAA